MNRIEMIKAAAEKGQIKKAIANVSARKRNIKAEMKLHKKLTKSMHKADQLSPRHLEAFHEDNLHYTAKETQTFLAGSSLMETYEAMKMQDDY
jgi:hypothetical protein|tara:strand:- start:548 stop:826 length:279 start_codon:yes stop_codon:yes gene_type:complete